MTCKDCIHSGLCYKENDYENFPDKCGSFILERPQGKWIFHKDFNESCRYGCNQCGNLTNINSRFCPNCGARMNEKEETNNEDS